MPGKAKGRKDHVDELRRRALLELPKENVLYFLEKTAPNLAPWQREIIRIAKIDEKKTKGEGLPINFNPRANMWRRLSSKTAVPVLAAQTPLEAAPFVWPEQFDAALAGPEQFEEAEKARAAGNAQTV